MERLAGAERHRHPASRTADVRPRELRSTTHEIEVPIRCEHVPCVQPRDGAQRDQERAPRGAPQLDRAILARRGEPPRRPDDTAPEGVQQRCRGPWAPRAVSWGHRHGALGENRIAGAGSADGGERVDVEAPDDTVGIRNADGSTVGGERGLGGPGARSTMSRTHERTTPRVRACVPQRDIVALRDRQDSRVSAESWPCSPPLVSWMSAAPCFPGTTTIRFPSGERDHLERLERRVTDQILLICVLKASALRARDPRARSHIRSS